MIIYTAIFGGFPNVLHRPQNIPDGVALHCYTDVAYEQKHPSGWTLLPPVWAHATNPRLRARRHKLLSHVLYPYAEYTLWLDGCLTPTVNPLELPKRYLETSDICLFRHQQRSCVYEEARACLQLKKDDPQILMHLVERYRLEGYPEGHGLAETTAVLRRRTDKTIALNELWWAELRNNSIRDQMSFDYCAWKLDVTYSTFAGTRTSCPYFSWRAHR